jgi:DNA-binding CsgD family transcriptional regulator
VLFLTRKYRPLLGLDITTSSVKLIELVMSGGSYRVESYAAEPTPQNAMNEKAIVDAEAVGEAIRRAVKRSGAGAKEVAIAISGDAAITKVIQMPRSLRERDLESQVEMQADQYIPFPMDEVSYDFEVLGPSEKDPETNDVLLVATRTENVEQRQAAVNAAGLTAKIVDVEAFALENACKLMTHQMPDGGIDRTTAVVPIDPKDSSAGATVLTGAGVVAAMCALFEQIWATANPLGVPNPLDAQGLGPEEREILRMLANGETDEHIARRLGVSTRTVGRKASELMRRLGTRSRFQMGVQANELGWLGPPQEACCEGLEAPHHVREGSELLSGYLDCAR